MAKEKNMTKQIILIVAIVSILTSLLSVGGAWVIMKVQVENNTEKIEKNISDIDCIEEDKEALSGNINEIKYNIKAICKALTIEYITLNGN